LRVSRPPEPKRSNAIVIDHLVTGFGYRAPTSALRQSGWLPCPSNAGTCTAALRHMVMNRHDVDNCPRSAFKPAEFGLEHAKSPSTKAAYRCRRTPPKC
jgi:hypothetical protein